MNRESGTNWQISRRAFGAVAAGTAIGLAGCSMASGSEDEEGTESSDANEEGAGKEIVAAITMVDFEDSHEFQLLIEQSGEILHWDSHEMEPGSAGPPYRRLVNPDIPGGQGEVTIHARVDGKKADATFSGGNIESDCLEARIVHEPSDDGEPLRIFRSAGGCTESE